MSNVNVAALVSAARDHWARGDFEQSEAVCLEALERCPDDAPALSLLSAIALAQERFHDAATLLVFGRTRHPRSIAFPRALAQLYLELLDFHHALEPLESCVLLEPSELSHKSRLLAAYEVCRFTSFRESSQLAMLACLREDRLAHEKLQKAWLSLLRVDPQSQPLLTALTCSTFAAFEQQLTPSSLEVWQRNEFFTLALGRFPIVDLSLERGLGFLRRWLLEHPHERQRALSLTLALARYCFNAEYVLPVTEELSALAKEPKSAADVALLASYEPLFGKAEAATWCKLSDAPAFRALLRYQLDEPREEARLRALLPQTTPVVDPVSLAVQQQYEENPYPRWTTLGTRPPPNRSALREAADKRILIAGCGSGREAADAALLFPSASVLGIDLSRASLAYGMRRAWELGLRNLRFECADLLELPADACPFDLIVCSGVLHHLAEPVRGFHALLSALKPQGVLRVALYSSAARVQLKKASDWAKQAGFSPSLHDIRRFRAAVSELEPSDPMRRQLSESADFYSLSGCRDLVFHVSERSFTLPELSELTHWLGLSVLRVETRNPLQEALYRQRFPDDPSAVCLANWHLLEQEHPGLFSAMICLWLCRQSERNAVNMDWLQNSSLG
ncbi:MAG TPA: methyltransferase domain-containing protein [Polyangiaceae bacterium]|nr:methyltransferase domain-containing protein [Polyangiaceae bacterium]